MNSKNKLEIIYNNFEEVIEKNIGKTEIRIIKYNEINFKEELCSKMS